MKTMSPNLKPFLDTIAYSEIGEGLLQVSDNGYDVIVGSTADRPILFNSYADHPRRLMTVNGLQSTAAGRYQILKRYFDFYKAMLKLKDFSPASQDAIAMQMFKECKALLDIEAGQFEHAVVKCNSRWASLPGAGYYQHENNMADLRKAYLKAGGTLA
jgi:muramidase (phage lysozyme)